MKSDQNILWFNQIDKEDLGLVGGKGANLGEMFSIKLPVPNGFVVTSRAYDLFLKNAAIKGEISQILKTVDVKDPQTINEASQKIQKLIRAQPVPPDLAKEIIHAYLKLGGAVRQALVAIRSSATAEDLPGASFAGQQETYLNVQGETRVVDRVRDCWASLFEPRAIFYREEKGFEHLKVGMAVPIQEMIPSDVSGVMFTIDPVSNDKKVIIIEAIWGLGEYIVQGKVTPDQYLVAKKSFEILRVNVARQTIQLVKARQENKETAVPRSKRAKRKLTDRQIIALAKLGQKIHQHYFFPQDIEWAMRKGKLWILQTRPVTTIESKEQKAKSEEENKIKETRKSILTGLGASPGIVSGRVKLIKQSRKIKDLKQGEILVTGMTTPDFVPAMRRAAAIVTDKGGQTSHAAIVSRELGTPCVVGTDKATKVLKNGQIITVNGSLGEIYQGSLKTGSKNIPSPFAAKKDDHLSLIRTATKIYVNLAEPELAEKVASQLVDGVGLLRAEFMLAALGQHPKKIIKEKKQLGYINKLAENLGKFAKAFAPRPVVYRTTDFKTNEYRHLVGGKAYEPYEENPLLGFRGAFRYLADPRVFNLELEAIKKVRNKMGLKNLWLMIPFCRTPDELSQVKKLLAAGGLMRSPSFKLWLMVEIPSNVILLDEFIKTGIDGVSIGSNDLTMLTLGVDRDNSELATAFKETDPAVLWALEKTITTCAQAGITSSICGQAATTSSELVEKLIGWGITSVSVNPDVVERTRELVYLTEKKVK